MCSALLHLILRTEVLDVIGVIVMPWIEMVTYQTYVLRCVASIMSRNDGNVNIDPDTYIERPAPEGISMFSTKGKR